MALKPASLRALKLLVESKDGELVQEGIAAYIDLTRIHAGTVLDLLSHMAISPAQGCGEGSFRIFVASGNAKHILARPALADEMVARVYQNKPFRVNDNGEVEDA